MFSSVLYIIIYSQIMKYKSSQLFFGNLFQIYILFMEAAILENCLVMIQSSIISLMKYKWLLTIMYSGGPCLELWGMEV